MQRSLASESKSIGYSISSLLPVGISFVSSSPFSPYHDSMGYQEKLRESESWDPLRCHKFLSGFCEDGSWLMEGLGRKDFGVKGFWGQRILGIIWFSDGTEGGVSHCQQSVGLFRQTSFSNSRKGRHQKSVQELHLSLWDSVSPLIVQPWVHALKYPIGWHLMGQITVAE